MTDTVVVSAAGAVESPLLTLKQFSIKHQWPIGGLRHLAFYKPDGFDGVLRRVGRKVLIHEKEFFEWVEKLNSKNCTSSYSSVKGGQNA